MMAARLAITCTRGNASPAPDWAGGEVCLRSKHTQLLNELVRDVSWGAVTVVRCERLPPLPPPPPNSRPWGVASSRHVLAEVDGTPNHAARHLPTT